MQNNITVNSVSKYYKYNAALIDVDLCLEDGHVYGLLGPNGAGKTTLCKILSTAIPPDVGNLKYFGNTFSKEESSELFIIKRNIGYLPQDPFVPGELTVVEYLLYAGGCLGLSGDELYVAVNHSMTLTGIAHLQNRIISSLSTGNIRRTAISAAVMAFPRFLILDEPSSSLDPEQNLLLRKIVEERKKEGFITIISSHNLYEIEELCDRVIIISDGRIVRQGDIATLSDKETYRIQLEVLGSCERVKQIIEKTLNRPCCHISCGRIIATLPHSVSIEKVSQAVTSSGNIITHLSILRPSLEDVYLKSLSGNNRKE